MPDRAALLADLDRCNREIAICESGIHAGHSDHGGLLQGLGDWEWERRRIVQALESVDA